MISKSLYLLFHYGQDMTNEKLVDLSEDKDWILNRAEEFLRKEWNEDAGGPEVRECMRKDVLLYNLPKNTVKAWITFMNEANLLWVEERVPNVTP